MFIAIALSFFLIVAVIGWHFWCIQGLYKIMPDNKDHSHFLRSVAVLLLLFAVHIVEILWFTGGLYFADVNLGLGGFSSKFDNTFQDYFYFSTVSYSTLGLSSFNPQGHLKVMTGLESLTGFIMLTWSATFFYSLTGKNKG
ncbi:MAG: hypothetical protein CMJ16_04800 [Peredibacter sp.]|nr:hypothetical protein [Peredibacter sp.]|tara:strand:- start:220 stop:642 length:423 start_codon:yes stop_codon:yes gene_type:complete